MLHDGIRENLNLTPSSEDWLLVKLTLCSTTIPLNFPNLFKNITQFHLLLFTNSELELSRYILFYSLGFSNKAATMSNEELREAMTVFALLVFLHLNVIWQASFQLELIFGELFVLIDSTSILREKIVTVKIFQRHLISCKLV